METSADNMYDCRHPCPQCYGSALRFSSKTPLAETASKAPIWSSCCRKCAKNF